MQDNNTKAVRAQRDLPYIPQAVGFDAQMDDQFPQFDYRSLGVPRIGDTGVAQGLGDDKPIPWPAAPYDHRHGEGVAKLALVIFSHSNAQALDTYENRAALWVAGLFHDIGRQMHFGMPDPEHGMRSATLTERILKTSAYWADTNLRERACRLIAHHSMPPSSATDDPLKVALWDADCYDAARFRPGTADGLNVWKERRKLVLSEFARNTDHMKRWARHRGWKL